MKSLGPCDTKEGKENGHGLAFAPNGAMDLPMTIFLTKTRKTALCQRQGLRPFGICSLRACERRASPRPQTANARFSCVKSCR